MHGMYLSKNNIEKNDNEKKTLTLMPKSLKRKKNTYFMICLNNSMIVFLIALKFFLWGKIIDFRAPLFLRLSRP